MQRVYHRNPLHTLHAYNHIITKSHFKIKQSIHTWCPNLVPKNDSP